MNRSRQNVYADEIVPVQTPFSGTEQVSENREGETTVDSRTHPEYQKMIGSWKQWRLGYEGGDEFVENFLKMFSKREDATSFKERKEITYLPAHAKGAINTVKNGIFQRLIDVSRIGGTPSYTTAIAGENGGVDLRSNSMNAFMGKNIISELLVQGKVGVYVDNQRFNGITKIETIGSRPYLYWYKAEDILNWQYNEQQQLTKLLLVDYRYTLDDKGLPDDVIEYYRFLELIPMGVRVTLLDNSNKIIATVLLKIKRIPFVIFELNQGLMKDIFMHQVALLNMASADVSYTSKSNFPFYTEQYDPRLTDHVRRSDPEGEGESTEAGVGRKETIQVGVAAGRRYPKGMERPQFIHPSDVPIRASMEKQIQVKEEIRQLVDLSLSNIQMKSASAESKKQDNLGLEAGLSAIGLTLETGETEVAEIWASYEISKKQNILISYPRTYNVRTDSERLDDASKKKNLKDAVPSVTYQKEISKSIVKDLLEFRIQTDILTKILNEIDKATITQTDVDTLLKSHEEGLISDIDAAVALGYPEATIDQARKDHAERIARIQQAQSSDKNQARGITDLAMNQKASKNEKELNNE